MRDYAKVSPLFWSGPTGRELRKLGHRTQLIALYLITGPSSNMIGLYYLSMPTLCHDTGSPLEGASKALRSLSEGGFALYNEAEETVFLPEMARFQIGEQLTANDNRCKGIWNELCNYRKSVFFKDFYAKYKDSFHLPSIEETSPFEAPCKDLRRGFAQEQEQEQEQEQDHDQEQEQEKKAAAPQVAVPANLDVPEFHQAWGDYIGYRISRKLSKLQPSSIERQLETLSAWGCEQAIKAIDNTIRNGWQGIFEEKKGASNGKPDGIRQGLSL